MKGNILFSEPVGSWDDVIGLSYCNRFKEKAAKFKGVNWAQFLDLSRWQLGAPSLEPLIIDLSCWAYENGLKYTAVLYYPNALKTYQIDKMLAKEASNYSRRHFTNDKDALAWLSGNGFRDDLIVK